MKRVWFFCCLLFFAIQITSYSQEDTTSNFSMGADLVSRYIWRGEKLSNSPAFQPTIAYSLGNLTIGAWGSYSFSSDPDQEADLFLTYSIGNLSVTLNDYFITNDTLQSDYFDWKKESTSHMLEGMITFDGPESFPFQLVAGVFLYGDYKDTIDYKSNFSTYFELNKTWEAGNYTVKPFIGVSPATGYYSEDGFQIVNLGLTVSRTLKFGSVEIPLGASFISNPHKKSAFMVFSITF